MAANSERALLLHVGEERIALLLQRSDLGSEVLQLPVDTCKLGLRSPAPMVAIVVRGLHEPLNFMPQEPQPWVPVNDPDPVLELTRVNRCFDLVLGQSKLLASGLVAQRRALSAPLFFHGLAPFARRRPRTIGDDGGRRLGDRYWTRTTRATQISRNARLTG